MSNHRADSAANTDEVLSRKGLHTACDVREREISHDFTGYVFIFRGQKVQSVIIFSKLLAVL